MDPRGYVTTVEIRRALHDMYEQDSETNLQKALLRLLSDDLKPVDEKGRWRPSPLVVLLVSLFIALVGIFLYFCVGAK